MKVKTRGESQELQLQVTFVKVVLAKLKAVNAMCEEASREQTPVGSLRREATENKIRKRLGLS